MAQDTTIIRDQIIEVLLPNVAFDGWTWGGVESATIEAGHKKDVARFVFSRGLSDVVAHFSDMTDRQMLESLSAINPDDLPMRNRIKRAVQTRLDLLVPHKEAVKLTLSYWSLPPRNFRVPKIVWQTSDMIWNWAGDTATDYNRYTKRGLLSGILGATTLVWLNDNDGSYQITHDFLDRRIENVMQLGKILGKIKRKN